MFFRSRIMSAVQSTTLPWMLCVINMNKNLLKNINSFDFFLLLCAFVYGNIFSIQCSKINWGFFVIFGIVFLIEISEIVFYLDFNSNKKTPSRTIPYFSFFRISPFCLVTTMKRGFLLGIFVEAFKVGS